MDQALFELAAISSFSTLFKDTDDTCSLPNGLSSLLCALWDILLFSAWVFSRFWLLPVPICQPCLLPQFALVYPCILTPPITILVSACPLLPLTVDQITWSVFWILPLGTPLGLIPPVLWITVCELCYCVTSHSVDYCFTLHTPVTLHLWFFCTWQTLLDCLNCALTLWDCVSLFTY